MRLTSLFEQSQAADDWLNHLINNEICNNSDANHDNRD